MHALQHFKNLDDALIQLNKTSMESWTHHTLNSHSFAYVNEEERRSYRAMTLNKKKI